MHPSQQVRIACTVAHAVWKLALDLIMDVVFVCNPVMHHLFLGIDAYELGQAPFALATSDALSLRALELDLNLHLRMHIFGAMHAIGNGPQNPIRVKKLLF
jgi:uncharacterized 2Fe-2S/4Fe-4S cluster protein (DUF4445 family)